MPCRVRLEQCACVCMCVHACVCTRVCDQMPFLIPRTQSVWSGKFHCLISVGDHVRILEGRDTGEDHCGRQLLTPQSAACSVPSCVGLRGPRNKAPPTRRLAQRTGVFSQSGGWKSEVGAGRWAPPEASPRLADCGLLAAWSPAPLCVRVLIL